MLSPEGSGSTGHPQALRQQVSDSSPDSLLCFFPALPARFFLLEEFYFYVLLQRLVVFFIFSSTFEIQHDTRWDRLANWHKNEISCQLVHSVTDSLFRFQPPESGDGSGQDNYKCDVPERAKHAQNEMKFFSSHGAINIKGKHASISYSKLVKQTDGKGPARREKHTRTSLPIKMSSFTTLYVCLFPARTSWSVL